MRLYIRKKYVNFLLCKARPDILHAISQIMRGNSTGWLNAKLSELVAGVLPDSFSGPTAFPNSHRLRQGMVGGGGRDSAARLQNSNPALHALLINPLHWAAMKKGLCATRHETEGTQTLRSGSTTRRHNSGPRCQAANSQAALLGLMRCQHSKLLPSRNCRNVCPSPNPPDGARRHRLVCPGTGQAQRAEILPFRNASGRFLSQRGCVVQHYQLLPNWKGR